MLVNRRLQRLERAVQPVAVFEAGILHGAGQCLACRLPRHLQSLGATFRLAVLQIHRQFPHPLLRLHDGGRRVVAHQLVVNTLNIEDGGDIVAELLRLKHQRVQRGQRFGSVLGMQAQAAALLDHQPGNGVLKPTLRQIELHNGAFAALANGILGDQPAAYCQAGPGMGRKIVASHGAQLA